MKKGTGEKQHAGGRTSTNERENTKQVRGKIQYNKKRQDREVVCDYKWLGAAWRCNQKAFWDPTRKENNAQGGLLGSHTSPLMEGNCEDNICSHACTWRQLLNVG